MSIENRVVVLGLAGPLLTLGVGNILQIIERTIVYDIVQALPLNTLNDPDHSLTGTNFELYGTYNPE
jgi:hypothetical protein